MTEPAISISKPAKDVVKEVITPKIPRLNERVLIGYYDTYDSDFKQHCMTIRKCGLVSEVVAIEGRRITLYAARRRNRNKHD